MRLLVIILMAGMVLTACAQRKAYSAANAHSHNDYEQTLPFELAYNEGFGSMEADIFLVDGDLFVAHEENNITREKTLKALYLDKINERLKARGGQIYGQSGSPFQLLIDIKSAAEPTLDSLIILLKQYPGIVGNKNITIVISGNRPSEKLYTGYPDWIHFDGRLGQVYSAAALSRIALLSEDFRKYCRWNGNGSISLEDSLKITRLVASAHSLKKPVRFWGSPDEPTAWRFLMQADVDYINTDRIKALAAFLKPR